MRLRRKFLVYQTAAVTGAVLVAAFLLFEARRADTERLAEVTARIRLDERAFDAARHCDDLARLLGGTDGTGVDSAGAILPPMSLALRAGDAKDAVRRLLAASGLPPAVPDDLRAALVTFEADLTALAPLSGSTTATGGTSAKSEAALAADARRLAEGLRGLGAKLATETNGSAAVPALIWTSLLAAAVPLIALIATLLAHGLLAPALRRLSRVRDHLAGANPDSLAPYTADTAPEGGAPDELTETIQALNGMVDSLSRSREGLVERWFVDRTLDLLPDALIVTNARGQILRTNPATNRMLMIPNTSLVNRPVATIFASGDAAPSLPESWWAGLLAGEPLAAEAALKCADGDPLPVSVAAVPLPRSDGTFNGAILLIRDLHQLAAAEAEIRRMQSQLQQAAKLAALGTLGAGVAHELNNPLVAVRGFAELIRDNAALPAGTRTQAGKIMQASVRMQRIIDHLRHFARDTSAEEFKPVDIRRPLEDALILIQSQLNREDIELVINMPPTPTVLLGDTNQLESIFQNILINARDAYTGVKDGRARRITVTAERRGNRLLLAIRDNAGGIAAADLRRIFDPFFTTKEAGRGTGLGLSITHNITTRHGGTVRAESTPGDGTTFYFTFPASDAVPAATPAAASAAPKVPEAAAPPARVSAPVKKPRLLLVDDEEIIVEVLVTFLEGAFEVTACTDPLEAVTALSARQFDIVVTDMKMPGMDGLDIVTRARATQRNIPLVIITGHAQSAPELEAATEQGVRLVLSKPFEDCASLAATLLGLLQPAPAESGGPFMERITAARRVPARAGGEKPCLLVIDDEEEITDLLRGMLADDFQIEARSDPEAALAAFDAARHAAVLTDMSMPGLSGTEITLRIKRLAPETPVVIMTGMHADDPACQAAMAAGAATVIAKPFTSFSAITATLTDLLAASPRRKAS